MHNKNNTMIELIDTHTHIYSKEDFAGEEEDIIQRLTEAGVTHAVLPNTNAKSIAEVLEFEARDPQRFHPLMGLHPEDVTENWEAELAPILEELGSRTYYGVGEVGIDLYWEAKYREEQIKVFCEQTAIAQEKDLPLIIHCRNALEDTLQCLRKFDKRHIRGIFHSFTGTREEAERIKECGDFKFGINGIVTFKKSTDLQATIAEMDLAELVLETDAPYLAPVPHRGKRNETAFIKNTAEKIAEIKGASLEEVASATTKNAKELFGI